MAHSYTPGLRVSARARVERERRLPLAGNVLVAFGQVVEAADLVAATSLPGDVTTLQIASQLGIDPPDLPEAMLTAVGTTVGKGQVIARGGGFLGMFKSEVVAPITGTVESVSKVTGQVLLRAEPRPITVDAYLSGTVVRVLPGEGVVIGTDAIFVQGIFGIGGEARGPIRIVAADPAEALQASRLQPEMRGSVLIGGAFAELPTIRRAIEVGAAALVVGGVEYGALRELLGYAIGVAVTGAEQIGITLIVTEGFGRIPMARRTFDLLRKSEGSIASVNGATQIRAGVIRPEIVIPLAPSSEHSLGPDDEAQAVEVGSVVRVIREPYFGLRGSVAGLPPELRRLETEGSVRVAEVALEDGRTVAVPRSNLERIES